MGGGFCAGVADVVGAGFAEGAVRRGDGGGDCCDSAKIDAPPDNKHQNVRAQFRSMFFICCMSQGNAQLSQYQRAKTHPKTSRYDTRSTS